MLYSKKYLVFYVFNTFSEMFFWPDMALPLRYGASVKDFTQKVKQELKGTKYANLLSDNASILIIGMTNLV